MRLQKWLPMLLVILALVSAHTIGAAPQRVTLEPDIIYRITCITDAQTMVAFSGEVTIVKNGTEDGKMHALVINKVESFTIFASLQGVRLVYAKGQLSIERLSSIYATVNLDPIKAYRLKNKLNSRNSLNLPGQDCADYVAYDSLGNVFVVDANSNVLDVPAKGTTVFIPLQASQLSYQTTSWEIKETTQ